MYKAYVVILVFALGLSCFVFAQEEPAKVVVQPLKTPDECKVLCDNFTQLLDKDKFDEAFALLKPHWPLPENEIAVLQAQTITQLNTIATRFGGIIGSEFISKKVVNDFIAKFTYVQKRQNHIIRWEFIFYKPKDSWLVNAIRFDDTIDALLQ